MLEVMPPKPIPMFPANYREFLMSPAAQQTLLPGQLFQLAQPRWPIDANAPSFYALVCTTMFVAFFLVAFKRLGAMINFEIRTRLGGAGDPILGTVLSLLSVTMLLSTYENDIKKRSGYYEEGSNPRRMIWFSAFATVCASFWASSTFQNPVSAQVQGNTDETRSEDNKQETRGFRRQQKKQAKREAKKVVKK